MADVGKRHERPVMNISDVRQGGASKGGWQPRQPDRLAGDPAPLGFQKGVNARGGGRAKAGQPRDLQELTSIHRRLRLLP